MKALNVELLFPFMVTTIVVIVTVLGGISLAAPAEEISFYVA